MGDGIESFKPLSTHDLAELRELVERLNTHDGPWGEWHGGERDAGGIVTMPWMQSGELADAARIWLGKHGRMVTFDWPAWEEGRAIFRDWTDTTAATLDRETVCRLLTAVSRNDRFNEGAWVDLFESGRGVALFNRLLACEEAGE